MIYELLILLITNLTDLFDISTYTLESSGSITITANSQTVVDKVIATIPNDAKCIINSYLLIVF